MRAPYKDRCATQCDDPTPVEGDTARKAKVSTPDITPDLRNKSQINLG
jgi:hypothetical protein